MIQAIMHAGMSSKRRSWRRRDLPIHIFNALAAIINFNFFTIQQYFFIPITYQQSIYFLDRQVMRICTFHSEQSLLKHRRAFCIRTCTAQQSIVRFLIREELGREHHLSTLRRRMKRATNRGSILDMDAYCGWQDRRCHWRLEEL